MKIALHYELNFKLILNTLSNFVIVIKNQSYFLGRLIHLHSEISVLKIYSHAEFIKHILFDGGNNNKNNNNPYEIALTTAVLLYE